MINVSSAVKQAYKNGNASTDIFLTIGNTEYDPTNILAGSVSITESFCSASQFDISRVEKNSLSFTLFNITENISDLQGETVVARQEITLAGETTPTVIPLGTYTIVSAVNDGDNLYKCECFDSTMLAFETIIDDWWNTTLTFPITLRNLAVALFTHLGITSNVPQTFTNYDYTISARPVFFQGVTASELLGYIQEVAGGFFKADRNGTMQFYTIQTVSQQDTSIIISNGSAGKETYTYRQIVGDLYIADYEVEPIDKLQVRGTEDDIGIIVGTGDNAYIITGNVLMYTLTDTTGSTVVTNIYNAIKDMSYIPFSARVMALPYVEVGDCVSLTTLKNKNATAPVLQRVLSGAKLSFDAFSANGEEEREEVPAVNRELKTLNQKTHEIINTVEEFSSTITDIESDISGLDAITTTHTTQIAQNASEITLQAQRTGYCNYIQNSNFTSIDGLLDMWETLNPDTSKFYCEMIADEEFSNSNGKALKITKTSEAESTTMYYYQTFDLGGINLNGKTIYFLFDIKFPTELNGKMVGLVQYQVQGSPTWIYGIYTTLHASEQTVGHKVRYRLSKSFSADTYVTNVRVMVPYPLNAYGVYEVNNLCLLILDSTETPPYGTWTDIPKNNLISQINLSPTGLKINADKITVDTSSLDLTFGSASSQVTIQATTGNDGVLFSGSGIVKFHTIGSFMVENMWDASYVSNNILASNYSNTSVIELYNNNATGSNMNFIKLNHYANNNWNRLLFQNNWISGSTANWIQCSNAGTTSDFQFYNYNSSGGNANKFEMQSTSGTNTIKLINYQRSGTDVVNSKIELNGDIVFTCQNRISFLYNGNGKQFFVSGASNGVAIGAEGISDTMLEAGKIILDAPNGVWIYENGSATPRRL